MYPIIEKLALFSVFFVILFLSLLVIAILSYLAFFDKDIFFSEVVDDEIEVFIRAYKYTKYKLEVDFIIYYYSCIG